MARVLKWGILFVPLAVGVALVELREGGMSLMTVTALALICYGGVASYVLGMRLARRCAELRNKSIREQRE
jgi:putative effector of murein hydrolase LrgA (UPF0299 family)